MSYVTPEAIEQAREIDLLTYLKHYEPNELVRFSQNTYTTRAHDSLKISNGKWMWWSKGIGGKSALDYLITVRCMTLQDAVVMLTGQQSIQPPNYAPKEKEPRKKTFTLPNAYGDTKRVTTYLRSRGIDMELIQYCIQTGRIYESNPYHNAVFVGMDCENQPRYAALRGINSDFIGEVGGSDKQYSFSLPAEKTADTMHIFESAIDLLSYGTLMKMYKMDWKKSHLLSLSGVYQPAKESEEYKMPAAITRFLKENSKLQKIMLHFDNDDAGRQASKAIRGGLFEHYFTADRPPPEGKDCNDYLCIKLGILTVNREKIRRKER